MDVLYFLLLAPLIAAVLLYVLPDHPVRDWLVRIAAVVIAGASLYLLATAFNKGTQLIAFPTEPAGYILEGLGLLLALVILALAVKYKKPVAAVLVLVNAALLLWFVVVYSPGMHVENNFFVDEFSIVMALIIGVIGSAICVYAVPYMRTFHVQHPEIPDRRRMFFFLLFAFLSAMFGIVFSNNLGWFLVFWEVTTFCSFVLIGYTRTEEAIDNAFLAVVLNLLGGIGFALALLWLGMTGGTLELDKLIAGGAAIALVPATLIALCRPDQGRAAAVLVLAPRRDGRADARLGPAPLLDDGQGRRLRDRQVRPRAREHAPRAPPRARRRASPSSRPRRSRSRSRTPSACSRTRPSRTSGSWSPAAGSGRTRRSGPRSC